jgi:hypothetical protein
MLKFIRVSEISSLILTLTRADNDLAIARLLDTVLTCKVLCNGK